MPSPFPGMNPYMEQPSVWEDFHMAFATQIRESLAAQVRPNFLVKLEERDYIREPSARERKKLVGKPDIVAERHATVEILDRLDRQLVTMIEILSPTNKRYGPDREQYLIANSTA